MHRRALLATAAAFLALAPAAFAETESKSVPAEKLFPFLSNYYSLPAAERSHFRLAYTMMVQGGKAEQVSLILQDGAKIVPNAQGYLAPLPTVAQLKGKLTYSRPAGVKFGVALDLLPTQAPAQTMDAKALALSVTQALKGSKKVAGLMAMALPTFDRIEIRGVSTGQVKLADGSTRALGLIGATKDKKGVYHPAHISYVPAEWPTAASVSFDAMPSKLLIEAKP
ncbi:hypothetical protein [Asticcacaulis benevestitus]|nr:hypothetical protein [Asticcacaulis benevestitus]